MKGTAYYTSGDGRVHLTRLVGAGPPVTLLMHRPSTATATKDDQTVTQATKILSRDGSFGEVRIVNVFDNEFKTGEWLSITDRKSPLILAPGSKVCSSVAKSRACLTQCIHAGFQAIYVFADTTAPLAVMPLPTRMSRDARIVPLTTAYIDAIEERIRRAGADVPTPASHCEGRGVGGIARAYREHMKPSVCMSTEGPRLSFFEVFIELDADSHGTVAPRFGGGESKRSSSDAMNSRSSASGSSSSGRGSSSSHSPSSMRPCDRFSVYDARARKASVR